MAEVCRILNLKRVLKYRKISRKDTVLSLTSHATPAYLVWITDWRRNAIKAATAVFWITLKEHWSRWHTAINHPVCIKFD